MKKSRIRVFATLLVAVCLVVFSGCVPQKKRKPEQKVKTEVKKAEKDVIKGTKNAEKEVKKETKKVEKGMDKK